MPPSRRNPTGGGWEADIGTLQHTTGRFPLSSGALPTSLNLPRTLGKSIQSGQVLPVPFVFLGRQPKKYLQIFKNQQIPIVWPWRQRQTERQQMWSQEDWGPPAWEWGRSWREKRWQGAMCTQIWGLITWWSLLSRRKTDDWLCRPGLPFLLVPLKSRSMFSPCTGSVGILTRGLDSEEMRREAIALSRSFPFMSLHLPAPFLWTLFS